MIFSIICVQTSAYGAADRLGTFAPAAPALLGGTRRKAGAREALGLHRTRHPTPAEAAAFLVADGTQVYVSAVVRSLSPVTSGDLPLTPARNP